MSDYDDDEEIQEEQGTNLGVYINKSYISNFIFSNKIFIIRNMKEKEMKKMNAMVLVKLNYPIMISMKVIIKMVKDMVKAPTSKIKFF